MSIWTSSKRRIPRPVFWLLLAGGLSACASSPRLGAVSRGPSPSDKIEVAGRVLNIKGPPGFCIDRQSSQIGDDLAFVLLGSCKVVSKRAFASSPKVKALLTASVSGGEEGGSIASSLTSMDSFFRSEDGRTALSRSADPGTVKVLETFQQDDMFFLRARDSSAGVVPDAADDYWRAYFDLNDQIVSVSVIGFKKDPITPDTGLTTLREFSNLIKSENGGVATPITVAAIEPVEEATEPTPRKKKKKIRDTGRTLWTIGLLRKLIN
jgi:hypothetical protein